MKIKAVLFDMDGLIFDTEGICKTSWQNAVSEQGLVLTDDYYQRFIGTQDVQCEQLLVDAFGERLDMARFRLVRDTMLEAERKKGVKFKAGFEDIFSELKGRSLQCALVTSSALPQVEHHFAGSDYLQYFNTIITAEKVENGKPAPDCYRMACEQLDIDPVHCLVLEDSNNGMRAGLNAGCHAVMIPDLLGPDADVAERATAVIASLSEVKQFL